MRKFTNLALTASFFTLVACGNQNSTKTAPASQNLLLTEAGYYEAKLSPINAHLATETSGSALIKVKADEFSAEVKIDGAAVQIPHRQAIHVADACPTLVSDLNNDGIIDAIEAQKDYGPMIIPLDMDLKTQLEVDQKFPNADFSGNYFYRQTVSMMEMLKDLTNKDLDLADNVVKLNSSLGLAGRQVVIYGVPESVELPESVGAMKNLSSHASLPIACGTLIKIAVDEGNSSTGGKD
jgi:hypothetical protein